jgi:hypothetical protein
MNKTAKYYSCTTGNPVKFETLTFQIAAIRQTITVYMSVGKWKTIYADSYMIIPRKYIYQSICPDTELYTNSMTVSCSFDEEMCI